jgi:hypothetical protein
MTWYTIRSFGDTDYTAVKRMWDPRSRSFCLCSSSCNRLTREMRRKDAWYVAGWKLHLSIYPADYPAALPALMKFEDRFATSGLVYKYAGSKKLYEDFVGEVKGKFATIYCKTPADVPTVIQQINQIFAQEGVTPVSRTTIEALDGLRHEIPLTGGYGFARYGAFCYTNGIIDLTDPGREPMPDSRHLPFPRFSDPARLAGEIDAFIHLVEQPAKWLPVDGHR